MTRLPTHEELPGIWNDIAVGLARQGHFASAAAAMRVALRIDPGSVDLLSNYGNILRRYGRPALADEVLIRAHGIDPCHAPMLSNIACLLLDCGEPDKAVALYDEALKQNPAEPDWLYGRACSLLMAGRWKEGFAAHECRLADRGYETASIPLWDGSPLEGRTLMVHAEQGLGDTIMFHRFLREYCARHKRPAYVVPHQLRDLLDSPSQATIYKAGTRFDGVTHHIPLMSLPAVLGIEKVSGEPYLVPAHRMALDPAPGTRHKIGLVWRAKANWKQQKPDELWHGRQKSMPLEVLLELTQIPGAQLFGLQVPSDDIEAIGAGHLVKDLQVHIHDFSDLASFLGQMDVVVSVDTAPAHLAGALGVPTVVCLHHAASWQWQTGERCSWYDSTRAVRQAEPGVWAVDQIIAKVREML